MQIRTLLVVASLVAILGACVHYDPPLPSPTGSVGPAAIESLAPDSSEVALGPVIGAWQSTPFQLGDPLVAVISDACAAAARDQLGDADADLPTALVDARGENVATAILTDDVRTIQCMVRIDSAGTATVDRVVRLAPSLVAPVDGVAITSLEQVPDREGDRMLVIGRVAPLAAAVKIGFADDTEVVAAVENGWYAAWWPGHAQASRIAALDAGGGGIAAIPAPPGLVNGELGRASWWLDPKAPRPNADTIEIRGFVLEEACASARTPEGRIEPPLFDLSESAVTVTFGIRHRPGSQDCQGNAPFPVTFRLPEPLADRALLDGNKVPPRDASEAPPG